MARYFHFVIKWIIVLVGAIFITIETNAFETQESVEQDIENYSGQIKANPENAVPYIRRGDAYFKILDLDSAINDYTRALEIDDSQDQAYFGRGLALGRRGLVDEGIADLTVFLKRNPDSSRGYTKRGVRYLWKRDLVNAKIDLTRAIEINPDNAEANDDLGVVLSLSKEYEKASQHFLTAIKIDPTYQKAYHNLAMSYYILGKDDWALAVVNDALDLQPESRESKMLKAKILEALGKTKEANELMEDAEFLPEGNWTEHVSVKNATIDPGLTLETLDKEHKHFIDVVGQGSWTIVNIWGPKCPPCLEEMPQLQAFQDDHSETDATVVGMAIDYPSFRYAKRDEVKKFIELNNITYPIFLGDAELARKIVGKELSAIPMTLGYSPDGALKWSHIGKVTADMLEQLINQ